MQRKAISTWRSPSSTNFAQHPGARWSSDNKNVFIASRINQNANLFIGEVPCYLVEGDYQLAAGASYSPRGLVMSFFNPTNSRYVMWDIRHRRLKFRALNLRRKWYGESDITDLPFDKLTWDKNTLQIHLRPPFMSNSIPSDFGWMNMAPESGGAGLEIYRTQTSAA